MIHESRLTVALVSSTDLLDATVPIPPPPLSLRGATSHRAPPGFAVTQVGDENSSSILSAGHAESRTR